VVTALRGDPGMSIDKDLLDRVMEGRAPNNLFDKTGILA
jgi:putative transposase